MSDPDQPTPPYREALKPSSPPMAMPAPSSIPHVSPHGIIKDDNPREWRWFWRKRKPRD